jgi:hypothetical protein
MTTILAMVCLAAQNQPKPVYQVKMRLSVEGEPIGTFEYGRSQAKTGEIVISTRHTFLEAAGGLVNTEERHYDKTGMAIKAIRKSPSPEQGAGMNIDFGDSGAKVNLDDGGLQLKQVIAMPKGAKLVDSTVLWWLKAPPKPGEFTKITEFNLDLFNWEKMTVKAVGPETLTLFGKSYATTKVERGQYETWWYDSKGLPVKIVIVDDLGRAVAERVS